MAIAKRVLRHSWVFSALVLVAACGGGQKTTSMASSSYIVNPHDTLVIDGFRTSDDAVAAFRFGRVADSYAAQTSGDRNVGVVGFAIFAERGAVWNRAELHTRDTADPFPSRGYAMPPR